MTGLAVSKRELVDQARALGVAISGVLVVHTSFREVHPVEGGPAGLIEALRSALGPQGTLIMPSMADDDDNPFDPTATPCLGVGIVADTFWRLPGVLRSDSPHAFAAIGPEAACLTAPHPIDLPHGLDSPVGRAYQLDGQVLLLGVDHDANTTIHLAESLAGVRYRRPKYVTIGKNGRLDRYDYTEIDHCCENFAFVNEWLDERGLQVRGKVGHGDARLARSRDIVDVVVERLRSNETAFLHAKGIDVECDEARASIPV